MSTNVESLSREMIENADRQAAIIALTDQEKRDLTLAEQENLDSLQTAYDRIEKSHRLISRNRQIEEHISAPRGPASIGLEPFGPDCNVPEGYDNQAPLRGRPSGNGRSPHTPVDQLSHGSRGESSSERHLSAHKWRHTPAAFSQNPQSLDCGGFRSFGEYTPRGLN